MNKDEIALDYKKELKKRISADYERRVKQWMAADPSQLIDTAEEITAARLIHDNIEDAIAEMIPTLRENKGEPFGSFKKLTMEDAAEIYRLAL